MQATIPHVEVPGDNESRIMARDGHCIGMSDKLAVWRFGYVFNRVQEGFEYRGHAEAHNVSIEDSAAFGVEYYGFLWVLATRRTGKIRDTCRGWAIDLPKQFLKVIEWQPN